MRFSHLLNLFPALVRAQQKSTDTRRKADPLNPPATAHNVTRFPPAVSIQTSVPSKNKTRLNPPVSDSRLTNRLLSAVRAPVLCLTTQHLAFPIPAFTDSFVPHPDEQNSAETTDQQNSFIETFGPEPQLDPCLCVRVQLWHWWWRAFVCGNLRFHACTISGCPVSVQWHPYGNCTKC